MAFSGEVGAGDAEIGRLAEHGRLGIARAINSRKRPSAKQADHGENALAEARKKGFTLAVPQTV